MCSSNQSCLEGGPAPKPFPALVVPGRREQEVGKNNTDFRGLPGHSQHSGLEHGGEDSPGQWSQAGSLQDVAHRAQTCCCPVSLGGFYFLFFEGTRAAESIPNQAQGKETMLRPGLSLCPSSAWQELSCPPSSQDKQLKGF